MAAQGGFLPACNRLCKGHALLTDRVAMTHPDRRLFLTLAAAAAVAACTPVRRPEVRASASSPMAPGSPELRARVDYWADHYGVPRSLVHRVVMRESRYNPAARNGPYWGLMQILPQTARTMGYQGSPEGLLDADTNMKYAVKYLRGAWMVSDGSEDRAVKWYASGYYYEAKRRGLLRETGLRT
jgi:soluble lytic murein transglycosylase-like protein